ncbi:MAG: 5'-3' exonuclease H3TH domain-containing protein [Planctomycetota bacterium]
MAAANGERGRLLHLVDASPYIFRAYFSLPTSITDRSGRPANAARGFLDMLSRLVRDEEPEHLLVAFDGSLTTSFRNDIYPAYKSSRELPDEELTAQLEDCYELAEAIGAMTCIDERYEADDLVATAKARFASAFDATVVVTADKDLTQLVDESTVFLDFAKGVRLGPDGVKERFGVRPEQIRDFLGLAGDSVDDIPGVRGVGPRTAVALLAEFDDLDALYADLDRVATLSIRGAKTLGPKLAEHREMAFLSRELATCATDAPLDLELDSLAYHGADAARLEPLLERLGLESRLRSVPHRSSS